VIFAITICTWGLTITAGVGSGGGGGMMMNNSSSSSDTPSAVSLYDKGVKADKTGDFKTALKYFNQANDQDRNNPEILNMLAHSQRKLGMIDEALANYNHALKIRPNFPEAREYLGEAYIQAAVREIEMLKGYGKAGDEQRDDLVKALKSAAGSVK